MQPRLLLLVPLFACTSSGTSSGDSASALPITLRIVSPKDGAHFDWDAKIPLEIGVKQGQADVEARVVDWTVGDQSFQGASTTAFGLDPGDYTVLVDAVVDGDHYGESVKITVDEKPGGDTGGDTGVPPGSVTYLGTMAAHVWYDGSYGTFDGDCPGNVTVYITDVGVMSGTGHCVLDGQFDMDFVIDGTQGKGAISGALVADVDGTEYRTPFTGTGKDGQHLDAAYDKTFNDAGESLRIAGTWAADPQ